MIGPAPSRQHQVLGSVNAPGGGDGDQVPRRDVSHLQSVLHDPSKPQELALESETPTSASVSVDVAVRMHFIFSKSIKI